MSGVLPKHEVPSLAVPDREEPWLVRGFFERQVSECRTEVVIQLDGAFIEMKADTDTDVLYAEFHDHAFQPRSGWVNVSDAVPWKRWVGKELGWHWLAMNSQGYWDTILWSFGGVAPVLMIHVVASSLTVSSIKERD